MTPPIFGLNISTPPASPTILSTDWMWDLEDWNLMADKRPNLPGFYVVHCKDADPAQRVLRWDGDNWELNGQDELDIRSWRELPESDDELEETEELGESRWRG